MGDIAAVRGIETTTDAFRVAFVAMCERLGLNPDYMAAVVSFESGFNPAARNPVSDASGLIQFMPGKKGSAAMLGYTTEQIRSMSAEEQVPLIERYMTELVKMPTVSRAKTITDHYLLVFGPNGVGKGESSPLYVAPSGAYAQNSNLDRDGDGIITNGEAASRVKEILATAEGKPRIPVVGANYTEKPTPPGAAKALVFLLGAALSYLGLRQAGKRWPVLKPKF